MPVVSNGDNHALAQVIRKIVETILLDRYKLSLPLLVELSCNTRFPAEELDHPDDAHHFKCIEYVSGRLPTIPPPD